MSENGDDVEKIEKIEKIFENPRKHQKQSQTKSISMTIPLNSASLLIFYLLFFLLFFNSATASSKKSKLFQNRKPHGLLRLDL